MQLSLMSCLSYLANMFTLSPIEQPYNQHPIGSHVRPEGVVDLLSVEDFPIFKPPTGRPRFEGSDFVCEYPNMPEYVFCGNEPNNRGCWLRPKDPASGLATYNIKTDYEKLTPNGTTREYEFTIRNGTINADGRAFTEAKLINDQYPGPWVQACWGDRIIVRVNNELQFNGTAIHWHGIRQHNTMHMDGVPGITQCPIAPHEYFTYNFAAKQYGSAWYHSHYSVQYADGLLGPLTIHGPHSADFDEPKLPLLMTDWFHNSAYQVIHGNTPGYPTVLLNGTGNINKYNYSTLVGYRALERVTNTSVLPPQYRLHFNRTLLQPASPDDGKRPPRYLLSLINTAFDTTFIFSIDHHTLQVISADFVPIVPYNTTHLHIGIGQRYNVIVTGNPVAYDDDPYGGEKNESFWIRTTASPCFRARNNLASLQGYDETGVLTYKPFLKDNPYEEIFPTTQRWPDIPELPKCQDEHVKDLVPIHRWKVGNAVNGHFPSGDNIDIVLPGERLDVVGDFMFDEKDPQKPTFNKDFPLAKFSLEREKHHYSFEPMQIDYNNTIFLHLNDSEEDTKLWPRKWAVVHETHPDDTWIWLTIAGRHINNKDPRNKDPSWTAGAHPMHLHGHDFAILQQAFNTTLNSSTWNPNTDNPPRRDVILLPEDGFVVIAFKVDNPGSWIMHCHIAFHASFGLAVQFMENKKAANAIWPPDDDAIIEAERVCSKWDAFQNDCTKHFPGYDKKYQCFPACNNKTSTLACPNIFQDDSGV